MTQVTDYTEYEINGYLFKRGSFAFVGTVSRTPCTIKRIYTYPNASSETPFVRVIYEDGYEGFMSLSELIHTDQPIIIEQPAEESGPDGWHTLKLSTDENGRIDFSAVDAIADDDLEYQHQRTMNELESMEAELAGTGEDVRWPTS